MSRRGNALCLPSCAQQSRWPASPGTYALILAAAAPLQLAVGRMGSFELGAGLYAYAGSAHGPGGLRARLARHLRREKRLHWHIDYLTTVLPIIHIDAITDSPEVDQQRSALRQPQDCESQTCPERSRRIANPKSQIRNRECAWVRRLLGLPGASVPIPGFGNSDCRNGCPAHLVRLPDGFDVDHLGGRNYTPGLLARS